MKEEEGNNNEQKEIDLEHNNDDDRDQDFKKNGKREKLYVKNDAGKEWY